MALFLGFGSIEIDFFYYAFLFFCGPVMFCYLFAFLPIERQLHAKYQRTGVSTQGRVTETKETGEDGSKTYYMRFAYTAPNSDAMYIKGFVEVPKRVLDRGRFTVLVLPGKPESGVPKYLIQDPSSCSSYEVFFMVVSPVILFYLIAVLTVWLEAPLFGSSDIASLPMSIHDVVLALLLIVGAALVPAWYIHRECIEQVPGNVHLVEETTPLLIRDENVSIPFSDDISVDQEEEEETIPMAEAMAIVSHEQDHEETLDEDEEAIELVPLHDIGLRVEQTDLPSAKAVTFHRRFEKTHDEPVSEIHIREAQVLAVV